MDATTYQQEEGCERNEDEEREHSRDGTVNQLLVGSELMVDLLLNLVRDARGANSRVDGGSLDFNVTQRVLERLVDLGSTDQEGHRVLACVVSELWISLGKVLTNRARENHKDASMHSSENALFGSNDTATS